MKEQFPQIISRNPTRRPKKEEESQKKNNFCKQQLTYYLLPLFRDSDPQFSKPRRRRYQKREIGRLDSEAIQIANQESGDQQRGGRRWIHHDARRRRFSLDKTTTSIRVRKNAANSWSEKGTIYGHRIPLGAKFLNYPYRKTVRLILIVNDRMIRGVFWG